MPDEPALPATCPSCGKVMELCVCAGIEAFDNRVFLLVLQHPQEQDRDLGTARLAIRHFARAELRIGLSWPNLAKALGRPADPHRWAVLYLGSLAGREGAPLTVYDRDDEPLGAAAARAVLGQIEGVVLLDGSWSQAKTLWWRNPWLLKLRRIVLNPDQPSRYGRLRKEPRPDSLSTLEAAALVMSDLAGNPEIAARLHASFDALLERYRKLGRPAPGRGARRRWKSVTSRRKAE